MISNWSNIKPSHVLKMRATCRIPLIWPLESLDYICIGGQMFTHFLKSLGVNNMNGNWKFGTDIESHGGT